MGPRLGGGGVPAAREEGTGGAGTLGEESLRRPDGLHHVTGVSSLTLT